MMRWYGSGMGPVGWLAMGLFWLILLGLIVWLVARLLPGSSAEKSGTTTESAAEILDRRLASEEIDVQAWRT
jgi:putative membrane protein